MKDPNMKSYYLKIREKFIDLIKEGIKKHEYRLASPERRNIKIGDNLVLISNQNNKNYVRTTVVAINIYNSWQDALKNYWEEDFKGLFDSLEDALIECHRFYKDEDVKRYGIIVFDVKPVKTNYSKASVLLDTNIIIKRESSNNVSPEVSKLFNWFGKKKVSMYVHKLTIDEIKAYGDKTIRNNMLLKLDSYNVMPDIVAIEDVFYTKTMSKYAHDPNSEIDNALLLEIYNDNVQLLVTDDSLMLRKAEDLYIRERVLSSIELLTIYENNSPKSIDYDVLNVRLTPFEKVDVNDSFFDTLREDYEGQKFDQWFKKKALSNEQAYVCKDKDTLKGFLYLKVEEQDEDYSDIEPVFKPAKRLKIGTFKIVSTGYRLGERFIKIITDWAIKEDVDEIYVTLFENRRKEVNALKKMLSAWGFCKFGYKKSNGELVMVKKMKEYDYSKDPKFNYPLIKKNQKHFFLPIKAVYHSMLFPDYKLKNEDTSLFEGNFGYRYAQEKVYLTGSWHKNVEPGDIVLIYRMADDWYKKYRSVVTGTAIVQEIIDTNNVNECIGECKDRSVFTEDEIRGIYDKYPTIVRLLVLETFDLKVPLEFLQDNNIVKQNSGPRPFQPLSKSNYDLIYKKGMKQ